MCWPPCTGHTGAVRDVALSAYGGVVASGSLDTITRLWNARTSAPVRSLEADRRYERLDITGLTGIAEAQHQALLALGVVDRSGGAPAAELAGVRADRQASG